MPKALMPFLNKYKKSYFKSDILAALVVTAIAIPESLGFAAIVGLHPVTGLYTALLAPIVFGMFAHTRRLVVGADSATAALIASGAVVVAQAGVVTYPNAIFVIGIVTAFILILMAAFRFDFIADLISRPVLVGFTAGIGMQLIATKFPEMVGVTTEGGLVDHVVGAFGQIASWNGMAVTLAVLVVGGMIISRRTKVPGALIGLVAASLLAAVFGMGQYGVEFVGELPKGLPNLVTIPADGLIGLALAVLPVAFSVAIIIVAQSSSTIRSAASEHDDPVRLDRDIFALGLANAASALTQGFAVNGSPPRTVAADLAGGRTQLVNILMSVFIGILLLFGAGLFEYLPYPALAAVVFMIGVHLIRFNELRYIWQAHKSEFVVAMVAMFGVALFGVQQGIFIAVIIALMERLMRQYRPKDQILLRDGELSEWAKTRIDQHHRHSSRPEGLLVYRFDGALFFENVDYFVERIKLAIRRAKEPVHYLLVDAGAIDTVDYTAVENIKRLNRQLGSDGTKLGFAHVSPNLRNEFDSYGVTNLLGEENIFETLNQAITGHPGNMRSSLDMVKRLDLKPDSYVVIGGAVLEALKLRMTYDVDVVVSEAVYRKYRDQKKWHEYAQDNGKRTLSHGGYNLMRSWMGRDLKKLQSDAQVVEGIPCMSVRQLIDAKQRLGRHKDLEDIKLLREYRRNKNHRSA